MKETNMPSGYTYKVNEGTEPSFETFALRCARAFGACINQRDSNTEYPDPSLAAPSEYYVDSMNEATAELARLEAISDSDLFDEMLADYEKNVLYHTNAIAKELAAEARYDEMLVQVEAWTPPTSDHEGLKQFMVEQLIDSKKFDGVTSYHTKALENLKAPTRDDITKVRNEKLKAAKKDFDYAKQHYEEDSEREQNRKEWIIDLFDSLNVDVVNDEVIPRT